MKKTEELKEMTTAELQQQLDDARKELFELRQKQVSGQIENPLRIRSVRRSVARLKTMMNQAGKAEG
jgi:large subunit ribosomal protein L29